MHPCWKYLSFVSFDRVIVLPILFSLQQIPFNFHVVSDFPPLFWRSNRLKPRACILPSPVPLQQKEFLLFQHRRENSIIDSLCSKMDGTLKAALWKCDVFVYLIPCPYTSPSHLIFDDVAGQRFAYLIHL